MSTLITLKVDDELKAQATAVLEELGLDASTAIIAIHPKVRTS